MGALRGPNPPGEREDGMAKMSLKEQGEWHRQRPEGAAGVWATVGEMGVKIGSTAGPGGLGLVAELREN